MNRTDYNSLAFAFINLKDYSYTEKDTILQGICDMLKIDDPTFDKNKFIRKIKNITHLQDGVTQ